MCVLRVFLIIVILQLLGQFGYAQLIVGSYPETRQLYKESQKHFQKQDYFSAAVALTQAIKKEPDNVTFLRDLALCYMLDQQPQKAKATVDMAMQKSDVDADCFLLAIQIYQNLGDLKGTKKIIAKGLEKYPKAGELYHSKGELHYSTGEYKEALDAWEDGIREDPAYHNNYYNAAKMQARNPDDFVKTIVYSESFINMESFSARTEEMKTILFNAYVKLINFINNDSLGSYHKHNSLQNFSSAFISTVADNISVINGNITAGNITQLRIRFLLDWNKTFDELFPLELLNYHNTLLVNGYYEAYNQWLLGKEANSTQFQAWARKNAQILNDFTGQLQTNKFAPKANEYYFGQ